MNGELLRSFSVCSHLARLHPAAPGQRRHRQQRMWVRPATLQKAGQALRGTTLVPLQQAPKQNSGHTASSSAQRGHLQARQSVPGQWRTLEPIVSTFRCDAVLVEDAKRAIWRTSLGPSGEASGKQKRDDFVSCKNSNHSPLKAYHLAGVRGGLGCADGWE